MKKMFSIFLMVLLSLSMVTPVFAVATPSDVSLEDYLANYEKIQLPADNPGLGVVEEWEGDDGNLVASDSDWDFEAWYDDVQSDLNFSGRVDIVPFGGEPSSYFYIPYADVVDSNGNWVRAIRGSYLDYPGVGNNLALYTWPDLPEGEKYGALFYSVPKSALPNPGKYGAQWSFIQFDIGLNWGGSGISVYAHKNGVRQESVYVNAVFSGFESVFCRGNVEIGYNTSTINLYTHITPISDLAVCVPRNDAFVFTFKSDSDVDTAVSPDVSAGSSSAGDVIAGSSQQIAQNTATMSDTLKEIVQTISKQLEALWNQQYNYIHLEDMANADKNADKIVNALGNELSVQIENDDRISEDIMDNADKNTENIMANDDKNTNTIVNGYDGSGMDSDNSRLDSSINEYEEAESEVLDKVNDELGGFVFSDSIDGYVSAVSLISGFLQDIYDNSGGFKDVINIGFFLSIASIVIGMYRFKEG